MGWLVLVTLKFVHPDSVLLVERAHTFVSFIHRAVLRELLRFLYVLEIIILLEWVVLHDVLLVRIDQLKDFGPVPYFVGQVRLIAQICLGLVDIFLFLVAAFGNCDEIFYPDLCLLLVVVVGIPGPSGEGARPLVERPSCLTPMSHFKLFHYELAIENLPGFLRLSLWVLRRSKALLLDAWDLMALALVLDKPHFDLWLMVHGTLLAAVDVG